MNSVWLKMEEIRSPWFESILEEWHPDPSYIEYLKERIKKGEYLAPVVVVRGDRGYVIVNGHHRYYAYLTMRKKRIKGFVLEGTFEETEPLRKAEVMLKEYDKKTSYKYQFSGYLDRWAAAAEKQDFVNSYRPVRYIYILSILRGLWGAIIRLLKTKGRTKAA
jgi:hypothetical protein